jgi:hypothetical protein
MADAGTMHYSQLPRSGFEPRDIIRFCLVQGLAVYVAADEEVAHIIRFCLVQGLAVYVAADEEVALVPKQGSARAEAGQGRRRYRPGQPGHGLRD